MADLCTNAKPVLRHVTALDKIDGPHRTADADQLHRYRNTALALALASTYYLDVDAPSIISRFPTLWPRTQRTSRPHTHDEVLLQRVRVADLLRRPRSLKLAGVYAMVDAGATPSETTGITASDFDDVTDGEEPTFMLIPQQNASISDRAVELDQFASHVLARVIQEASVRRLGANSPLTYTAAAGGRYSPSSSVSGMLDRFQEALGIKNPDTTAASTRRWRVQTTFDLHGIDAAIEIAGEPKARLPKLITMPPPIEDVDEIPSIRGFCS